MRSVAAACAIVVALAPGAPSRADDDTRFSLPGPHDTTQPDDESYSYYYVPRLSELNQLVGYLFRTGLIRKDVPAATAAISRYAAYSCEGTLYVGGEREPRAGADIDWSTVSGLRGGPVDEPPSLVIERAPPAPGGALPLVLYVADATIRYQLHQALAVLVSECRPRDARQVAAPHERRGN